MKIPQFDLTRQGAALGSDLDDAVRRVLRSGRFVLGPEGEAFEAEAAAVLGAPYAVGVASGSDALKLVLLAKHLEGKIVTNDGNLEKVAKVRGVTCINLNVLAVALREQYVPGDRLEVKIARPGEKQQGVGFLADGTRAGDEFQIDHPLGLAAARANLPRIGSDVLVAVDPENVALFRKGGRP